MNTEITIPTPLGNFRLVLQTADGATHSQWSENPTGFRDLLAAAAHGLRNRVHLEVATRRRNAEAETLEKEKATAK